LLVAWFINMLHNPASLLFGGALAAILVVVGLWHRSRAFARATEEFNEAESDAADLPETSNVLTLEEAVDAAAVESAPVMVATRYANQKLLEDAAIYAKGLKRPSVYVIYVDELPSLFLPPEVKPSKEAVKALDEAVAYLAKLKITGIPIWRMAEDAGYSIAEAARDLKVRNVFVGASKRSFFWRMVRGRMLKRLAALLPESANLIIVG
jgi:hypothetical protein